MTTIAVIGTAGRTGRDRLSPPLYRAAFQRLGQICADLPKPWHFRSGGAPWMDHLAVLAYLSTRDQGTKLALCLPTPWEGSKFFDTGERDWRVNPGGTLNFYHRLFSGMMRASSLADLEAARLAGAEFEVYAGFHARNVQIVTSADVVVALTWGAEEPDSSGTAHAWRATPVRARKIHVSLVDLLPEPSSQLISAVQRGHQSVPSGSLTCAVSGC